MSLDFAATQRFLTGLWAMEDVGRPAFRLMGWNRQEYQPPPGLALDERYRDNFINQMRTALEVCTYPDDGMPQLHPHRHARIGVRMPDRPRTRPGAQGAAGRAQHRRF